MRTKEVIEEVIKYKVLDDVITDFQSILYAIRNFYGDWDRSFAKVAIWCAAMIIYGNRVKNCNNG